MSKTLMLPFIALLALAACTDETPLDVTADPSQDLSGGPLSAPLAMPGSPAAPTGVVATVHSSTRIVVSWVDSPDETSYMVARRERPAGGDWGAWAVIHTTWRAGVTSITNSGRTAGSSYVYRVKACNMAGCSGWAASLPVFVPRTPARVDPEAAALSTTQVRVTWVDSSSNETHFELSRGYPTEGSPSYDPPFRVNANAVRFVDGGLTPGGRYFYRLRACNGLVCSNWLATGVSVPSSPVLPPALNARVEVGAGVSLSWTDPNPHEHRFSLQRRRRNADGSHGVWQDVAYQAPNVTQYTDTTVAAGARYTYRITACWFTLCSAWSNAVSVTAQ